jgi:transposase
MVRDLIKRHFGISMALTSVGNLLHRLGLTVQRPLVRAYEQDPIAVEHWLKVEYPKIRRQAKKAGGIIFFEDESGMRSDYHSGTTWAPRGKTPIVLRTGKRLSCNMLSAVSARGELRFMVISGNVNAVVFIQFLKRLMHGTSYPIFLVVDGHSSHRAKITARFVESPLNGKIRLFFLPAYSPELNPDERVWRQIKHHDIGRQSLEDANELMSKVHKALQSVQHRPATVRSFFTEPTTRYAK